MHDHLEYRAFKLIKGRAMNYWVVNFIPLAERKPDTQIKTGFVILPNVRLGASMAILLTRLPLCSDDKKYSYTERNVFISNQIKKSTSPCKGFVIFKETLSNEMHGFHTYQLFSNEGRPISEETDTCDHPIFSMLDEEAHAKTLWQQPIPVTHISFFSDIATARSTLLRPESRVPLLSVEEFNRRVATQRKISTYAFGVCLQTRVPFIKPQDFHSPLLSHYDEPSLITMAHDSQIEITAAKRAFDHLTSTSIHDLFLQYARNLERIAFCMIRKIGMGVIATTTFEAGEFVGFYDGEWRANSSGCQTQYRKKTALSDHKHPDVEYHTFIDGLRCGSFINFTNSAPGKPIEEKECEPATLIQLSIRADSYTHNVFVTRRKIYPGEQLTWQYPLHTNIKNIKMDKYGFDIEELQQHAHKGLATLIPYLANNQLKGFGELLFYLSLRELCMLAIAFKLKSVTSSLKTASTVIDETEVRSLRFK